MTSVLNYIIWLISFGKYSLYNNNNNKNNNIADDFLLINLNDNSILTEDEYDKLITHNYDKKNDVLNIRINSTPIKNDIINFKFRSNHQFRQIKEPLKNINKQDMIINEIKQKKQLKNAFIECSDGSKLSFIDNNPETSKKIVQSKLKKIQIENPRTILDEIHEGIKLKKVNIN